MITERTLRRWRRDALRALDEQYSSPATSPEGHNVSSLQADESNQRILRLTQELLDQHLLRRS